MIRRDYILRMIEEFFQSLSQIHARKKEQRWQDADVLVDEEFNRLLGAGAEAVGRLSETELLAKLVRGESTQIVQHKTLQLATLLREAGDLATAEGRGDQGQLYYLKGLHLLLDILAANQVFECPGFVPKVEEFVAALQDARLPARTLAALMRHYETTGELGKAEDALYALLDEGPDNPAILDFGILFYERLRGKSSIALEEGNLSRPEVESGLAELKQRKGPIASQ